MSDAGTPPVIPTDLQVYNSYAVDPLWQRKFSMIWVIATAVLIVTRLPRFTSSVRSGRAYRTFCGVREDLAFATGYQSAQDSRKGASGVEGVYPTRRRSRWRGFEDRVVALQGAAGWWMPPGLGMSIGQIGLVAGYAAAVIACTVIDAPLVSNSNRAGFLALAQLPPVFLFAAKNSIVSFLLGPGIGYEKLNYIHRWSGRFLILSATVHGALWIKNHLDYGLPIIGQQKEGAGVAALGLLGVLAVSSLPVARRLCYQVFYILHMLCFIGFFATLCYHTVYAAPWIFPPLAFYGLDILLRMLRHRIKDAVLEPVGNQMTLIHIPHATSGWLAGQHVRLRVFFMGRIFESHPLTIYNAPPDVTCISRSNTKYGAGGISLGARAVGDWTKALNLYAVRELGELRSRNMLNTKSIRPAQTAAEVPVQVMIDGPYGGCSVDLGEHETAVLFAGGSGITFTLGVLDDIVGRVVRLRRIGGERTRRIEFVWCVRSFAMIDWFASALSDIALVARSSASSPLPLDVHFSIYVTCLCDPEALPRIPNCTVIMQRPCVYRALRALVRPSMHNRHTRLSHTSSAYGEETEVEASGTSVTEKGRGEVTQLDCTPDAEAESIKDIRVPFLASVGGGVSVCASGPESLVREVANTVARLQLSGDGVRIGGIALHTELFSL